MYFKSCSIDWIHSSTQCFFFLVFWSFSCRETTDSYTIAASPNFGYLGHGPSVTSFGFDHHSKSNLDLDGKSPLLSDYERSYQKQDLDSISRAQSSLSEKAPFHKQVTGELPIGHGCSLTQTVFNGKLWYSSVLLLLQWDTWSEPLFDISYILVLVEKFLIYVKRYQITNTHHRKRMTNVWYKV